MRFVSFVLAVAVACLVRTAGAAEDPKKLFESATAEFNLGHYEKAASMYEEVYKTTLEPVLLYNIAQARRLGGDLERAIFFYKGYLRAQPQAKNRVEVQRRIIELEAAVEVKKRTQERPPNAPVTAEGQPATTAPATEPPPPTPAPREPAVASEPPTTTTSTNAPNLVQTKPPADKPLTKKPWFWAVVGVGAVVVVGVAVGLGVGLKPGDPSPALGAVTVH